MKKLFWTGIVLFVALAIRAQTAARPTFWPLQIGNCLYMRMELALTAAEQQKGLMHRLSLPADGGMLFAFRQERPLAFWMKNTLIPLDILYLDAKGTVVAIHTMAVERPMREGENEQLYDSILAGYPSGKPAQFAIELNAGQAKKCGVKTGDVVDVRWDDLKKCLPGD